MGKWLFSTRGLLAGIILVLLLLATACATKLGGDTTSPTPAQQAVEQATPEVNVLPQVVTPTPTPTPYSEPWRLTGEGPPPGLFPTPKYPTTGPFAVSPVPAGGPTTEGLPPGFTRGEKPFMTVPAIPPPTPSTTQQSSILSAALADPRVGPRITGKKYRVLHYYTMTIPAEVTERANDPCYNVLCGTTAIFNYIDNEWYSIIVRMDNNKVVQLSTYDAKKDAPSLSKEEVEIAKTLALNNPEVAQKAAGRQVKYFTFQEGVAGGHRGVRIFLTVGEGTPNYEVFIVGVDLAKEAVLNINR